MKLLLAEDDIISRKLLLPRLEAWGYDVVEAVDGEQAWEVIRSPGSPGLLVLDWEMPGMTGVDVCRKIGNLGDTNHYFIIMVTCRDQPEDIIEAFEAGADDFISKPYNLSELKARIQVGKRILTLMERLSEKEKLHGALEMAGAVCHELNQPLQSMSGFVELIMQDLSEDDSQYRRLLHIANGVSRISELTKRMMGITRYRSRDYVAGTMIFDIDTDETATNGQYGKPENNRGTNENSDS